MSQESEKYNKFRCYGQSLFHKDIGRRGEVFQREQGKIGIMCRAMEDMRKESLQEGVKEGAINSAKRMITDGILTLEKIAEYTGLPLDEVKQLKITYTA